MEGRFSFTFRCKRTQIKIGGKTIYFFYSLKQPKRRRRKKQRTKKKRRKYQQEKSQRKLKVYLNITEFPLRNIL